MELATFFRFPCKRRLLSKLLSESQLGHRLVRRWKIILISSRLLRARTARMYSGLSSRRSIPRIARGMRVEVARFAILGVSMIFKTVGAVTTWYHRAMEVSR